MQPDDSLSPDSALADSFSARLTLIAKSHPGGVKQFAKVLGVHVGTVRKWREAQGGTEPRRSDLIAMAELADVSLLWLMTGQGDMRSRPDTGLVLQRYVGGDLSQAFVAGTRLPGEYFARLGLPASDALIEAFIDSDDQGVYYPKGTWVIAEPALRSEPPRAGAYIVQFDARPEEISVRQLMNLARAEFEISLAGDSATTERYSWMPALGGFATSSAGDRFVTPIGRVLWTGALH